MALILRKGKSETWKEAMLRYARPYHLEEDVLETFTRLTKNGLSEAQAAWDALYEWDLVTELGGLELPDEEVSDG